MKLYNYIIILLCVFYLSSVSQNKYNKYGKRKGRWIIYTDSAKTKKLSEGRFRNDKAVGKWFYYTPAGVKERKEIYIFKKLKTTLYYPDGTVSLKGSARIEVLPDKIHYYFFGKWKYFNEDGKSVKYVFYDKGKSIKTVYIDRNIKTNDSLVNALNTIEKDFTSNNQSLIDSIKMFSHNIKKCELLEQRLFLSDSITFNKIGILLKQYGYPGKDKVNQSTDVPFYILSYAPAAVKEKYLNYLKDAADKNIISWSSLAFYIDKMKIAKGEKQIYGTQYFYNKDNLIYYPIIEPEALFTRRKSVGLEE